MGFEPTRPFGLALFKSAPFNRAPAHPLMSNQFPSPLLRMLYSVEVDLGMAVRANKLKIFESIAATIASPHNMMNNKDILISVAAALAFPASIQKKPSLKRL